MMNSPTLFNLSDVETADGDTLVHLLARKRLKDALRYLPNLTREEKVELKNILKDRENTSGQQALNILLRYGCQVNAPNKAGLTAFDIVWNRVRDSVKFKSKKLTVLDPDDMHLMKVLFESGSGPSQKGIREFADISVGILSHNRLVTGLYVPTPQQVLDWIPVSAILNENTNISPQAEFLQYLIKESLGKSRHKDIIASILVLKSCCFLAHPCVSDEGLLLDFFKAIKNLFDSSPTLHRWFLIRGVSRELIPIAKFLCGNERCGSINEQDDATGQSPLYLAANYGLFKVVRTLLEHPQINVNINGSMTPSPLMAALVKVRRPEIWASEIFSHFLHTVRLLAERPDQDLTVTDLVNSNPLSSCVKVLGDMGCRYREKHLYYSLHQNKRRKIKVSIEKDLSVAIFCVQEGLEKELMELMRDHYDLDLWWTRPDGQNVMHIASKRGMHNLVTALLKKDKELCNTPDSFGNTPLFYILRYIEPQHALQIINGYKDYWDFTHKNLHNEMAVTYYENTRSKHKNKEILRLMKDLTDHPPGSTIQRIGPLRRSQQTTMQTGPKLTEGAVTVEIENFVSQLFEMEHIFKRLATLSDKQTINALDGEKKTPLMYCSERGLLAEMEFLLKNKLDLDLNRQGWNGFSSLHIAAKANQVDCALCLLQEESLNPNIQDNEGNSALFYMMVRFTTIEAIRVLRDKRWYFHLTNNIHQNVYDFYKDNTDQLDSMLEDALRRRCTREQGSTNSPFDKWKITKTHRMSAFAERSRLDSLNTHSVKKVWDRVRENRIYFISNFVDSDIFFDYLIQEQVIDIDTMRARFSPLRQTDRQVAEALLEYLPRRGNVFSKFLEALDISNQTHISNKLREITEDIVSPFAQTTVTEPRPVDFNTDTSSSIGDADEGSLDESFYQPSAGRNCSRQTSENTVPKESDPYGFPNCPNGLDQLDNLSLSSHSSG